MKNQIGLCAKLNDTDGLVFSSYSLKDRGELYIKYPEIDKQMFGGTFPDYIKFIINKEAKQEEFQFYLSMGRRI